MKKIISMMMVAAMALFAVSCDKDESIDNSGTDSEYGLTGDKYVGSLTTFYGGNSIGETLDYVLYADATTGNVTIMMPAAQFVDSMPAIDMAMLEIPLVSLNPDKYVLDEATMVGIYSHKPLINNIVKSITDVDVQIFYDGSIVVSFDCTVETETMGDMTADVIFEGVKATGATTGFYIGISAGYTSEIENATVTYYKGDNSIVVNGFKFTNAIPAGGVLPIIGLTEDVDDDSTILYGDNIDVNYTVMFDPQEGVVTNLDCEITDGADQLSFYVSYDGYDYPCTFYGEIAVEEGSYTTTPEFSLDSSDGFYVTTQNSGEVNISDVTVDYYEGDKTIVINGFKYTSSPYAPSTTLAISGVTYSVELTTGKVTLSGDDIPVAYDMSGDEYEGVVSDFKCEIIDGKAKLEYSILYGEVDYPCTYSGDITISEDSYVSYE